MSVKNYAIAGGTEHLHEAIGANFPIDELLEYCTVGFGEYGCAFPHKIARFERFSVEGSHYSGMDRLERLLRLQRQTDTTESLARGGLG